MTTSTDERRALIATALINRGLGSQQAGVWATQMLLEFKAAGMVLVPREATAEMLTEGVWDISPWHPAYDTEEGRKAAMRDAWNGMIAAATEADNG